MDADTQEPLADAIVTCSWAFSRGLSFSTPETFRSFTTTTNADGRYQIPVLKRFPMGLTTRLARFSLVAYKKNYVAFRHDRIFNQRHGRISFSQLNNVIRLSRWSPELSHARHLLFLGGGSDLQTASGWEVSAAAEELDGRNPQSSFANALPSFDRLPSPRGGRLEAKLLISSDEVRSITGFKGAFGEGRLPGSPAENYDTFHLRAVDMPERYDVAVRIWRLSGKDLVAKYEEILQALPGSKQEDAMGDRSFRAEQGEILGLGFMVRNTSTVILLTCGRGQCTQASHLSELAKKVEKNLSRLPLISEEEPSSPGSKGDQAPPGGNPPSPDEDEDEKTPERTEP